MTESSKTVAAVFADLRENGFKKKGLVWCRRSDETVFSFELQKSAHRDRFFANVGVWLLSLGEASHLPPNRCHMYGRVGGGDVEAALEFGTREMAERVTVLGRFKTEMLLPIADKCRSVKGAAETLVSGVLRVPMVRPDARAVLMPNEPHGPGQQ